jgi:hypothetical protein
MHVKQCNPQMKNTKYRELGHYLAGCISYGLIEGVGNIWIPKSERSSKK